jgi:uncharacterized UBP type Zn finger protein
MTEKNPFDDIAQQWMQMLQSVPEMTSEEKEFSEIQAQAYMMIMQGMQAFATGFGQRAVEQFRNAAGDIASISEMAARIEALEQRLGEAEAEIAALKKKPAAARRKPAAAKKTKS